MEYLHFTRPVERLSVSRPALSDRIHGLERAWGATSEVVSFDRP